MKILEAKYEAKLEFPGEMGGAKQNPSLGGVWIFSGTADYNTYVEGKTERYAIYKLHVCKTVQHIERLVTNCVLNNLYFLSGVSI